MKKAKIIYSSQVPNQKKIVEVITALGYEAYFYEENNKAEELVH